MQDEPIENDFVEGVETQQEKPDQQPSVTPPVTPPAPDAMTTALQELTATMRQSQQPKGGSAPKAAMTPEQEAEYWAIYDPEKSKPDFMKKFFRLNPEATPEEVKEAKELFDDMQKGMVRQAVVGAKNLFDQQLAKLREEFGPVQEYVSAAQARETRKDFEGLFPSLADAKFSGILKAQATLLASQQFDSRESYFKALAEGAAATIKSVVPTFELGAKPQTPSAQTSRLPRSGAGGTGGAGGTHVPSNKSGDDSDSIEWT